MKFLKSIKARIAALAFGVAVAGLALAGGAAYTGYNPLTNLNGTPGLTTALGTLPTLGASTSCGTTATVQASMVGGASTFQLTAGATSCSLVIVFNTSAQGGTPNGIFCIAVDETTPADTLKQTAHSALQVTISGTVVLSDNILIECNGF